MSLMKSLYKSELTAAKKQKLLNKIKSLHIVFQVGSARFDARRCTGVAIDEAALDDNIVFTRPGGGSAEYYDLADVIEIRRLRSQKWLVKINASADPAQATP